MYAMPQTFFSSLARACTVAVCALQAGSVLAEVNADVQGVALRWLRGSAAEIVTSAGAPLKVSVSVGELDARLKLAPCAAMEAYAPVGSRLWGRTRVGVRCVDGATRWNVTVPATVQALGAAWVVKNPITVGQTLADNDLVLAEVDWAAEGDPVLLERDAWAGQIATRALSTGQTLRKSMVKAAQVFQPGAAIRVVAQGTGFQVTGDAQALTAGVVGQSARVRMESGRVSSGVVVDAHTVRIDL